MAHLPKGVNGFNTDVPDILEEENLNEEWKDLDPFAEEKNSIDVPEPKGNELKMTPEIVADHVHDLETWRSVKRP